MKPMSIEGKTGQVNGSVEPVNERGKVVTGKTKEKPWYKLDARWPLWSSITERVISQQIHDEAARWGWKPFRTHYSKHSDPGWPDLTLLKDGLQFSLELKREGKRPTEVQWETLHLLATQRDVRCFIIYPHDMTELNYVLAHPNPGEYGAFWVLEHELEPVYANDYDEHCRLHGWVPVGHRCREFDG